MRAISSSRPTVSVVIPNFNRETLIGETLENLLRQSLPPHEIIVVDDGSTDRSVEVVRSFGEKIQLIRQANQGPGTARNAGLRAATGDFVQFQDSDDLFSLNKLEVQAGLLSRTGADVALGPWVKARIDGRTLALEDHVLQQELPPAKISLPCWWLRGWSTVFQSLLFRRTFLEKVGFYRTDLMPSEDTEYFFRLLTSFPRVAFSSDALMIYRLHEANKITQDEGTSRARRIIDWARCLRCMVQRSETTGLKIDAGTRQLLLAGIQKHLRYLEAVAEPPAELVEFLREETARKPAAWLQLVEFYARLAERVRLNLRGARWMPAYRSARLTDAQARLIEELGFERST